MYFIFEGKSECSASLSLVSKLCKQLPDSEIKQQLSDILGQVQDKQNAYKIMMKNSNGQNGAGSVSWSIQEFPSERALKFLWMRLSLFSGILDRVIDFICKESRYIEVSNCVFALALFSYQVFALSVVLFQQILRQRIIHV